MEYVKDCYYLIINALGHRMTIRRSNAFTVAGSLNHWKSFDYIKHGTYMIKFNDEVLEKGLLKPREQG